MNQNWTRIGAVDGGELLSGCVRGANHCDKGTPCQDASLAGIHYYRGHPYVLLAVADGHGSASYARSEFGAHFAVRAAAEAAARWILFAVASLEDRPDDWLPNARNEFGLRFAKLLRQIWERTVDEHLAACPLQVAAQDAESARKVYGTTVAVALIFHGQMFAGAVGDSTVFLVKDAAGEVAAVDLLTGDKNDALGLATDSLASADAAYRWKHRVLPLDGVQMVLAATDGFADSLAEPGRVLASLQQDVQAKGFHWLRDRLPDFLLRLTGQGVGDDIATVFYFPPSRRSGLQAATAAEAGNESAAGQPSNPSIAA
ncbi:MAG: protein phosphatase 2C domain-containing protein [Candidatus Methylumidiphilus sp.]